MHEAFGASSVSELLARHRDNDLYVARAFASSGIPASPWIDQVGWEKTRLANSGPLAKRETLVMGRHGDLFTGRLVCWASGPRSRFSSWTGSYSQVGEIFGLMGPSMTSSQLQWKQWVLWMNRQLSALEMSYDNALYKSILHYITLHYMRISQQPRPENWWQHRRRSVD